jgi:hypothetical protein
MNKNSTIIGTRIWRKTVTNKKKKEISEKRDEKKE